MRKKGMMTLVLSALLSLGIMAGTVWAAEGWTQEGSSWVYYDSDGRKVTNTWRKGADNLWRYLDGSGNMALNSWVDDEYYVDSNGIMVTDQWQKIAVNDSRISSTGYAWYYLGSSGKMISDTWKKINDKWYLFDNDGVMQTGWANDNMVYLGDDGAMRVGWLLLDPPEDEYYDDDDDDDYGPFASNEGFDVNGKYWYYFKTDGEKFVPDDEYELRKNDGDYYCFDEYGRMRTGWINVDGEDTIKSYRLMGSDGRMRTGWYSSTPPEDLEGDIFEDEVNWYYFSSKGEPYMGPEEGSATTSDFEKINGNTYLFNEYGNPVYGLQKVLVNGEETAYYFGDDKQTSCMIKGERRIEEGDGTMWDYYFTESGSHAGRGYTGVKDNYLYYKGKLQKAESKYQMFEIPTGSSGNTTTYVVNSSGRIPKNTTVKDINGDKLKVNSRGVVTEINGEKYDDSYSGGEAPVDPEWWN